MPSSGTLTFEPRNEEPIGTPSVSGQAALLPKLPEDVLARAFVHFCGAAAPVGFSGAAASLTIRMGEIFGSLRESAAYADLFDVEFGMVPERGAEVVPVVHPRDVEYEVVAPQQSRRVRVLRATVRRTSREWPGLGLTDEDIAGLAHGEF